MHISILKAPRSQALKKSTCFGSLDASLPCLDLSSSMSINIYKDVVFCGTQFEKCSHGRFGR